MGRLLRAIIAVPGGALAGLGGVIVALIGYVTIPVEARAYYVGAIGTLMLVWLVLIVVAWRAHYLAGRFKTLPDFHATTTFVQPMTLRNNNVIVLAGILVENRGGVGSDTRDWEMWAVVNGEFVQGVYAVGWPHWDSHIQNTAGRVEPGASRSGAFGAAFYGATLAAIDLYSVTLCYWDAFGRKYTTPLPKPEVVVPHLPRPAQGSISAKDAPPGALIKCVEIESADETPLGD